MLTKLVWKTSGSLSARKSALASMPCKGDLSSCEMEPMKSAFCRFAATDVSLETVMIVSGIDQIELKTGTQTLCHDAIIESRNEIELHLSGEYLHVRVIENETTRKPSQRA